MKELLKEFYDLTKDQIFSVNEFRQHGLHFKVKNSGRFFHWMSQKKYTEAVGNVRVKHGAGHERWVFQWKWTDKAHLEFGKPRAIQTTFSGDVIGGVTAKTITAELTIDYPSLRKKKEVEE